MFFICTDLLLPLKVTFSYFEIQIFMLLKLESESAVQKICNRIRNRRCFGRIAIPDIFLFNNKKTTFMELTIPFYIQFSTALGRICKLSYLLVDKT